MIAALYARVSTSDQDNSLQIAELTRYAESRGWRPVVFQDRMSGGKNDRPGLKDLMDAAQRRLVDVVLVWKLDRFGRSSRDLLNNIEALKTAGVRFMCITQGIDTDQSNPVSHLLLTILSAVAEFERDIIVERVRSGQKRARENGVRFGPPLRIFNRARAQEMRKAGASIREIAKSLDVGVGTIHRLVVGVPGVVLQNGAIAHSGGNISSGRFERPKG